MAVISEDPKFGIREAVKDHFRKHGVLFTGTIIIGFIITVVNGIMLWNAMQYMLRADQQIQISERVGRLEGKIEFLEQFVLVSGTPTGTP